jgi:adenosyl cobinamide kinase/adenosyl cobinamide phosphate guanylyltransferase
MKKQMIILGGAHSGKTDLAAEVCDRFEKVVWWGTASEQPQDSDWQERLRALRNGRKPSWMTLDGPWAWLAERESSPARLKDCDIFVVDCLNLWLAAHIHRGTSLYSMSQLRVHLELEFSRLVEELSALSCGIIVVSAEVGSGVVPSGEAGRLFRDLLTHWNRQFVQQSEYGVSVQAGQAFLWPAGKTPLPDEGVPVRCVSARTLSRLFTNG